VKFSPEVQEILDRVKAGEPILTPAEKRERAREIRAAKPKPVRAPRPAPARGPHGSRRPRLEVSTQRAILEQYRAGATIRGLARELGIHEGTVRNCLQWHDAWVPNQQAGTPLRRDDLCPITILTLWEQGHSAYRIAKQLGADRTTITVRLREMGVEIESRPGGGRPASSVCGKGHNKGGPGTCRECRRASYRAYHERRKARHVA